MVEENLVSGIQSVIGMPQNFAGEIVLYTVACVLFVIIFGIVIISLFRRWW